MEFSTIFNYVFNWSLFGVDSTLAALYGGVGLLVAGCLIVLGETLGRLIWSVIDETKMGVVNSRFLLETKSCLILGFSPLAFIWALKGVVLIFLLLLKFWGLTLGIVFFILFIYLARFTRRLFKRFEIHENNKNIHNKENSFD